MATYCPHCGEDTEIQPWNCPLSRREVEVLSLIAQDNPNKVIATRLEISDQTVKNHITSIHRKLRVYSRLGAVLKALQLGILPHDIVLPQNN